MAALFAHLEEPPRAKPTGRKSDPNLPYKRLLLAMLYELGLRLMDNLRIEWPRIGRPSVRRCSATTKRSTWERGAGMGGYPTMLTRRRLLLTTALVPPGILPAPHPAAAYGLTPELDDTGRVVVWVNPQGMTALRLALLK